VAIYDTLGKDAITTNYNNDVTNNNFIDPTTLPSGNQFVECVEGDCGEVKMFGGVGGLPGGDPTQLTEMTFGSALTDAVTYKDIPFEWIPGDVGYNVSAVDSVYMPVAMEPLNNPLIPYIGSVKPPADIRKILTQWVKDHPGWPVYKGFPADHPRIPEAHTVFFDAFLANDTLNTNSELTAPTAGGPIDNMIKLYLGCMKATPPLTDTCQRIQTLEKTLFQPNLAIYKSFDCGTNFNATVTWQLRTLYGWVPYNFNEKGVKCTGNDLALTLGTDKNAQALYQQLSNSYRLDQTAQHPQPGLQYNFRTEKDSKLWFNPYVELIHGANYLNMRNYAFSIDDAVGFQSHKADGLIFAVGGTRGLQNPHELQPNEVVNVAYGNGSSKWKSVGLCSKSVDTITLDPKFPSFDFYPRNIIVPTGAPCMVSALNANGKVYQFIMNAVPPDPIKLDCTGVTDPAFCSGINIVPNLPDHLTTPAINIK
jgi:hypothetical protein